MRRSASSGAAKKAVRAVSAVLSGGPAVLSAGPAVLSAGPAGLGNAPGVSPGPCKCPPCTRHISSHSEPYPRWIWPATNGYGYSGKAQPENIARKIKYFDFVWHHRFGPYPGVSLTISRPRLDHILLVMVLPNNHIQVQPDHIQVEP